MDLHKRFRNHIIGPNRSRGRHPANAELCDTKKSRSYLNGRKKLHGYLGGSMYVTSGCGGLNALVYPARPLLRFAVTVNANGAV